MSKTKVMENKIYTALGLMSGTSLDGVDAAIIQTDGERLFGFGRATCVDFPDDGAPVKEAVETALAWRFKGPAPNSLAAGSDYIDRVHVDAVQALGAEGVDIIGYHGQTVFHQPAIGGVKGRTLQLGNGQSLAAKFNVPCVYDFRSADVEAGGQGAPLAPIYHKALVAYSNLIGCVAVVNIGGVSNMTLVEGEAPLIATDCGPGNGPLDSWMALNGRGSYDTDGQASWAGQVDMARIDRWLARDFFKRPVPRSADRYDFDVLADMQDMSVEDGAATLASFCAQSIARDLKAFAPQTVIVCGGGRHNPAIMGMLDMHCAAKIMKAEDVGWDGDALEAQAFAYLAVRSLRGLPISFPGTTGVKTPMTGGVVVHP